MNSTTKNGRVLLRAWIIINYLTLIIIVAVFMLDHLHNWHNFLIPIEVISGSLFIWSFYRAYWITGSWSIMHAPLKALEMQSRGSIMSVCRLSYQSFTIVLLILLLVFSIAEISLHVVLVVSLIYFAHILPASIYQWKKSN